MTLQPVILCGGSGTRLWPSSREQSPKQLLAFGSRHSMLQATALRIGSGAASGQKTHASAAPIVVANEQYRFITAEQLREIGVTAQSIVLEPMGRNTAPALTVAALIAADGAADVALLVMPADHVIVDETAFRRAIEIALPLAEQGRIVTFGIVPTSAETGYGYIEAGAAVGEHGFAIAAFAEKPDLARAESYLASGRYYWNSGIFLLQASVWLKAVEELQPAMLSACRAAVQQGQVDRDFLRLDRASFEVCPADSIDYAVDGTFARRSGCHGTAGGGLVRCRLLGCPAGTCWSATAAVIRLPGMSSRSKPATAWCVPKAVWWQPSVLNNTIVIETPDAVLVASRDQLQQVKQVVARLKSLGRSESDAHRKIYRPWGYYDSIDQGDRFQVKRIVVNPLAQLSLQMHHHRAEHWIVVRGTARVTRGEETFLLAENQSTYIPLGIKHRLENPGKVPLEMIEVQSGSYLGEGRHRALRRHLWSRLTVNRQARRRRFQRQPAWHR